MIDPRNLHIRAEHLVRSVTWDCPNGNEYFLVGDGDQFYIDRMQAALDQHFPYDTILASPSRHEAIVLERASASETIAQHVNRIGSFTVFDENICRFMQITKTGVARRGLVAS